MSGSGSRAVAVICLIGGIAAGVWVGYLASSASHGGLFPGRARPVRVTTPEDASTSRVPATGSATGEPVQLPGQGDLADLVERCQPAVVAVGAVVDRAELLEMARQLRQRMPDLPQLDPEQLQRSQADPLQPDRIFMPLGSGFIGSEDGSVITNNHVVAELEQRKAKIGVRTADGKILAGELAGTDVETDLAAIRVPEAKGTRFLEWGDSDGTRVGDYVVAIGSPFGLEATVTLGIVSAKGRQNVTPAQANAHTYDDFLQTDAAINPGNSGGPLISLDGRVVGINTAIQTNTPDPTRAGSIGIGFAIPARVASFVTGQILSKGEVTRGYIGVTLPGPDIERERGTWGNGAILAGVPEGQPAANAGLRAGDLVTEIGGTPVRSAKELIEAVTVQPVDADVVVRFEREGQQMETDVRVMRRPPPDQLLADTEEEQPRQSEPEEEPRGILEEFMGQFAP